VKSLCFTKKQGFYWKPNCCRKDYRKTKNSLFLKSLGSIQLYQNIQYLNIAIRPVGTVAEVGFWRAEHGRLFDTIFFVDAPLVADDVTGCRRQQRGYSGLDEKTGAQRRHDVIVGERGRGRRAEAERAGRQAGAERQKLGSFEKQRRLITDEISLFSTRFRFTMWNFLVLLCILRRALLFFPRIIDKLSNLYFDTRRSIFYIIFDNHFWNELVCARFCMSSCSAMICFKFGFVTVINGKYIKNCIKSNEALWKMIFLNSNIHWRSTVKYFSDTISQKCMMTCFLEIIFHDEISYINLVLFRICNIVIWQEKFLLNFPTSTFWTWEYS